MVCTYFVHQMSKSSSYHSMLHKPTSGRQMIRWFLHLIFTRCWLLDGTTCVLPYVSYFFGYAFYCFSVTRQNLKSSDHQLTINIWWPPNASQHCGYMTIIFVKWSLDGNYLTSYIWLSKTWNNQIVDAWFIHLK